MANKIWYSIGGVQCWLRKNKRKRCDWFDVRSNWFSWNDSRRIVRGKRFVKTTDKPFLFKSIGIHFGLENNDTIDVQVPRDRNSTFEPVIIPKHEKRTPLFNDQIISMYSFGVSTRDIQRHLQQVYGVEVSPETISNITEMHYE